MKTYADLQAQFDRRVAWLRRHCQHEMWREGVPGSSGRGLYCVQCQAELQWEVTTTTFGATSGTTWGETPPWTNPPSWGSGVYYVP